MTLSLNMLIQHIESLLTICKATLNSEDAIRLQKQLFQFKYVDANELLRYALIGNKENLGGFISGNTVELLQVSA